MIITANKLSNLFKDNQRIGQGLFPRLISKLIRASLKSCDYLRFPYGDTIWANGVDGFVHNSEKGSGIVPFEDSVWEVGTDQNATRKANSDYKSRTEKGTEYDKSKYTFVFCTPHIWSGEILNWEAEKKNMCVWQDVRLIDGSMIAEWLDANLEIAIWLLHEFGEKVRTDDITTLECEVKRIKELTEKSITYQMLICSNENESKKLIEMLSNNEMTFHVIKPAINYEQGYFFIIGALANENNSDINSRVIIVKSKEALKTVNLHCRNKIVIMYFTDFIDEYDERNKYISIATNKTQTPTLELSPIFFDDFNKALESMGYETMETHAITSKVNRNISCFKRIYARNPNIRKPKWADETNKMDVMPIALLSGIDFTRAADRGITSRLISGSIVDYITRLDEILKYTDSPIFKDDNVYRIYSKEEALLVLEIEYNSPKMLILEKICKEEIITSKNPKYEKPMDKWYIEDGSYQYTRHLITGILDTFAILSNCDDAQSHYDNFVDDILKPMKNDVILLRTHITFLPLLTEVSAKSVLTFANELIDANNDCMSCLLQSYGVSFSSRCDLLYLYWAIKSCLCRRDYAIDAQRTLLKLYLKDFQSSSKRQIDDEIIESFAPILSSEYAITPKEKKDILAIASKSFTEVESVLAERIFYKMRWNQVNNFMVPSKPKWKEYKKHDNTYSYQEWAEVNDFATEWLYSNASDRVNLLSKVLDYNTLFRAEENHIKKVVEDVSKKIIEPIADAEIKRKLNIRINEINKRYKRMVKENTKLKTITNALTELYKSTLPEDLFERAKNLFEREHVSMFDLDDDDDESLDYVKKQNKIINELKVVIQKLIEERGESVLNDLFQLTHDNNYVAWKVFFDLSKDKIADMKKLITYKKNIAFIRYIEVMESLCEKIKKMILNITDEEQKVYIIKRLPLRDDCIDFVESSGLENIYWNREISYVRKSDMSPKIYGKMLKFCPLNLITSILYDEGGIKLDAAVEVLKAIIEFEQVATKEGRKIWFPNNAEHLVRLLDKVDEKYYTDELIHCEFQLLGTYISAHHRSGLPHGIREFFWRNPNVFFNFYADLLKSDAIKKDETVAQRLIFQALQPFGRTSFIPLEYMITKPEDFTRWCNTIMSNAIIEEKGILHKFATIICNILGLCPEDKKQTVWPTKAIADVLDSMNQYWTTEDIKELNEFYQQRYPEARTITKEERIASLFSMAKTNSFGVRHVTDGSYELETAKRYLSYAEQYKITNPITTEALKLIVQHFERDGMNDRKRAISGRGHY